MQVQTAAACKEYHCQFAWMAVMDFDKPGINRIKAIKMIRKKFDALPILMQTIFVNNDTIFYNLRAGGSGYLQKKASTEKKFQASGKRLV